MSPRKNRRDVPGRRASGAAWNAGVEDGPDGTWNVVPVPGARAVKPYRCPGCDQEIAAGVPHVVAWPADGPGGADERRHWHTPCWKARTRRGPRVLRSRGAPRY
ncbi:ATP/GTP-binding protein [Actinomadura rayongensis]|uniref:ATP/GTP-binding protein n=1 Tax=Actinomadura rayongensis TaxID=1429076 RepID=A0A6I4W6Q0_9ACTN|nr:ATP/GTP-binding protein [Actinomadura rayongensis]MXQ62824.1 ATP/GTP-binding protein [Actinomadura rayongensis]